MTKFWLMTKSTTAALCLLGIGANTALGMEALASESDLRDLDECNTFTTTEELSAEEAIAFSNCTSSSLDNTEIEGETEALDYSDRVEFEEISAPSWQDENGTWETTAPLSSETEAEWENVPDVASEDWQDSQAGETLETEWDSIPDVASEAEWENVPDVASEDWQDSQAGETLETEWENVPDAASEDWQGSAATWETAPDTSLEAWNAPAPEVITDDWANVPDAAAEGWEDGVEWDNTPDPVATPEEKPAIATETHWENLEDDPQFQAVLQSDNTKEEVAKLAPEDLIRDDRQVSDLIAPTPEQQQQKTAGLPPEQFIRAAETNSQPDMAAFEATVETPLLDRLDADLRRLRNQAEIVASQSLNAPIFTPQAIAVETYGVNFNATHFNDDYGTISPQDLERWSAQLAAEFNFEDEFAFKNAIDAEAIANSMNPQLFSQDLSELGLEIFNTELLAGDAIASSFLFAENSFQIPTFGVITIDFDSVLTDWENAIGHVNLSQDLATLIPAYLQTEGSLSFAGEMPNLSWQGEDIFAIESTFEEIPDVNFGTHPFEFGFKHDLLRASIPLSSQKSM